VDQAVSGNVQGRPKTLAEAKRWMLDRVASRVHPMGVLDPSDDTALVESLQGLDPERWTAVWREAGHRTVAAAEAAVARQDPAAALRLLTRASGYYFLGRFPCPNHPLKEECARLERQTYLAASRYWAQPIERIEIAFAGRQHEGDRVIVYLRRPASAHTSRNPPPVVLMWGGVDAWKEQMTAASNAFLASGIATIAMDNAGTGESPVKGTADAERAFLTVMDWARTRSDLRAGRIGLLGRSFGGYWATKLAHLMPERIAGAVNWGGGVHFMFQRDWIEASRYPDSYLMELVETRMRMLGATDDAGYIEGFARLSLLDQGLLDRPCAPLLLVNGKDDRQCPPADIHLLLEHGSPKSVRLFPGGHMGNTPQTLPTVVTWLSDRLQEANR